MLQVIINRSIYLDVLLLTSSFLKANPLFIKNNISLVTRFTITCNYIMQYWIYKSQNASVINIEHSILFIQHGFDLAFTNYVKTINELFLEIRICFIWMSAKISPNFNHHISTFNVDFVIFTDWFLVRLLCELFISSRANWKIYTSRHIVLFDTYYLVITNRSDLNHAECLISPSF